MKLQNSYADKPALFQLLILLILMLFGSCIAGLTGFMVINNPETGATANELRMIQLISAVAMFLFPALGAGYLFSNRIQGYLYIGKTPDIRVLFLIVGSMLTITPVISITSIFNQQLTLPSFMAPIETWMKAQELAMEQITRLLLQEKGIAILLFNLLVIAIVAGITEEFLFRGALQRILQKWVPNPHTVIWTAAFIFSAFHMQFYGLIPRMLLGAYLGYLLYWSKNIYLPIFAHFTNNALGVLLMSNQALSENKILSDKALLADVLPVALVCLPLFIFFVWQIRGCLANTEEHL